MALTCPPPFGRHRTALGGDIREQSVESVARVEERLAKYRRVPASIASRRSGLVPQEEEGVVQKVMHEEWISSNRPRFRGSPFDCVRADGMGFLADEVRDAGEYLRNPPMDHVQPNNPKQYVPGVRHRVEIGTAAPPQAATHYLLYEHQADGSYKGATFEGINACCGAAYSCAKADGASDEEAARASVAARAAVGLACAPQVKLTAHTPWCWCCGQS